MLPNDRLEAKPTIIVETSPNGLQTVPELAEGAKGAEGQSSHPLLVNIFGQRAACPTIAETSQVFETCEVWVALLLEATASGFPNELYETGMLCWTIWSRMI